MPSQIIISRVVTYAYFFECINFLLYIQLIFYALFIQISDREIEYIKSLNDRLDASNTILLVQKLKKKRKMSIVF